MKRRDEYEIKRWIAGKRTGRSRQNVSSLVQTEKMKQKEQCKEHELRIWRQMHG
jgi:hypothetical protein